MKPKKQVYSRTFTASLAEESSDEDTGLEKTSGEDLVQRVRMSISQAAQVAKQLSIPAPAVPSMLSPRPSTPGRSMLPTFGGESDVTNIQCNDSTTDKAEAEPAAIPPALDPKDLGVILPTELDERVVRLMQISLLLRGPAGRKKRSNPEVSLLPAETPEQVHLEFVPRQGEGMQAWVGAELVLWASEEAAQDGLPQVGSFSLMKIAKVTHGAQEGSVWPVKLKIYNKAKEVKMEVMNFPTQERAAAWSEALTEGVVLVREARGKQKATQPAP